LYIVKSSKRLIKKSNEKRIAVAFEEVMMAEMKMMAPHNPKNVRFLRSVRGCDIVRFASMDARVDQKADS